MPRLHVLLRALICAAILVLAIVHNALAAQPRPTVPTAHQGEENAAGTLVALGWSSFTIRIGGHPMAVVRALTAAANAVARGDYPYVYGGGHAEAGTASIGIKGPGYNGRRVGFDCSGSVAAVLAGAGLLPAGMPVPNDAGIIAELRREKLIARGVGHGANAVTFWDKPGAHIFMSIDGHDFGTSDGGAGNPGQPHGGAGWLNDAAPDASNPAFKPYHLVAAELHATTVYGPTLTFSTGRAYDLLEGVAVGDRLRVSYTRGRTGTLTAAAVTDTPGAAKTPVARQITAVSPPST